MSVDIRVEKWLRRMGYNSNIPSNLSKICNPSTAFIWEQFISNIKSRQEVKYKKRNIILNRLTTKPLEQQDQFSYPLKEIEIYTEKQRVANKITHLENIIEEKEVLIEDLLKNNDITYVSIGNIRANIKENGEKRFLLKKKSKVVKEDIQRARETLTLARNITPIEMEVNTNGDEITKTLQKCAEKLLKFSEGIGALKMNTNQSLVTSVMSGPKTPKYSSKTNTFSKYLNQSTMLSDIASKKLKQGRKNNLSSRYMNFSENGNKDYGNNNTDNKPKRESLGLLPNECLNISDDVDAFLLSPEHSHLQPSSFEFVDGLKTESLKPFANTNNEMIDKLCSNKDVNEALKDLLHQNNRHLILIKSKNVYEALLKEIMTEIVDCNKLLKSGKGIDQGDLLHLYLIHMKNELEKDKSRIVLKKLEETVKRRKEEILSHLCSKVNAEDIKTTFDLQITEAYLTGVNHFLQKEMDSSMKIKNNNEVQVITLKIKQAKEEIIYKNDWIQNLIADAYKVLRDIRSVREEVSLCIKRLMPYFHDLTWASVMAEEISQEIVTFKKFPLEYNRKFKYIQQKAYYRDVNDTTIPSYIQLDSNDLKMITTIMNEPFFSGENVILDILRTEIMCNTLQAVESQAESLDANYTTYTPEELSRREEYVEFVVKQLNSIINSDSVKDVLLAPIYMKKVADLLVEMSFTNFISDKRQVDGHSYKFYANFLEERKIL